MIPCPITSPFLAFNIIVPETTTPALSSFLSGIEYTTQPLALKQGAKSRIVNRHPCPAPGIGVGVLIGGTGVFVGVLVGVTHGLLYLSINVCSGPPLAYRPIAHTSPDWATAATSLKML